MRCGENKTILVAERTTVMHDEEREDSNILVRRYSDRFRTFPEQANIGIDASDPAFIVKGTLHGLFDVVDECRRSFAPVVDSSELTHLDENTSKSTPSCK